MQEVLRQMNEEAEYYRLKCIVHIFKKDKFMELNRLSVKAIKVTWDA